MVLKTMNRGVLSHLLQKMTNWLSPFKDMAALMELAPTLMQYNSDDWKDHVSFSDADYTRTVLFPSQNGNKDELRAILIGWSKGQTARKHGHAGSCLLKVLSGELEEIRFDPTNPEKVLSVSKLYPGMVAYIDDNVGLHSVANLSEEPAVSLHLYYSPKELPTETPRKVVSKHWFFDNIGETMKGVL